MNVQPSIIILPSSQYDLNNVEKDVKHQIIIIIIIIIPSSSMAKGIHKVIYLHMNNFLHIHYSNCKNEALMLYVVCSGPSLQLKSIIG